MQALLDVFNSLRLAEPLRHNNLSMIPLLSTRPLENEPLLSRREAVARGWLELTEARLPGLAPHLDLRNGATRPLLLRAGESLPGADVLHIVTESLMLAPGARYVLSGCALSLPSREAQPPLHERARARLTEAVNRQAGEGIELALAASLRQELQLKAEALDLGEAPPTPAHFQSEYAELIAQWSAALPAQPGQVGAIFAINGEARALELFAHPQNLAEALPTLVGSLVIDAIEEWDFRPACGRIDSTPLLGSLVGARLSERPFSSPCRSVHIDAAEACGIALLDGEQLLHLALHSRPEPLPQREFPMTPLYPSLNNLARPALLN